MKFSRKTVFKLGRIALLSLAFVPIAQAESTCPSPWNVRSLKAKHFLIMEMKEQGQLGPACDLVVDGFLFNEAEKNVSLKIRPATFCPVDAIAERKAQFAWALPNGLRNSKDSLRLVINDIEVGTIQLESVSAHFLGDCK